MSAQALQLKSDVEARDGKAVVHEIALSENDPNLVDWTGEDDPENPLNWSRRRKWAITVLCSLSDTVTLMSGSMMAPALDEISVDLRSDPETTQIFLSIFILAFAFGPLFWAPLSEIWGRRPVWLAGGVVYVIWNTVGGFANSKALMIISRILAGFGASGEFAILMPVLADCWRPEQRGLSFSIATFVPLLGPGLGPILGGIIASGLGWRWIFWIVTIIDASLLLIGIPFFFETYAPVLLHHKACRLRKQGHSERYAACERQHVNLRARLTTSFSRPFRFMVQQPVIIYMGILLAINFGILYIVLSTFASLWILKYGESTTISGLHYIAIVLGYTIASQGGSRIMDILWARLKARAGGATAPEYRVPLMIPGAILLPLGLLWYGWTAQAKTHWIIVDIGITVYGCGIILNTQAMQAYVMEAFRGYTASAAAASQVLRNVTGFAFPIWAPALYTKLGYGWGNSVLALIFIVFGAPAPLILWKFGATMRAKGAVVR